MNAIQTIPGLADEPPHEVRDLGEPEAVHRAVDPSVAYRPMWRLAIAGGAAVIAVCLLILLVQWLVGTPITVGALAVLGGGCLVGVIFMLVPFQIATGRPIAYWLYPSALVMHREGEFLVVPWPAMHGMVSAGHDEVHMKDRTRLPMTDCTARADDLRRAVFERVSAAARTEAWSAIERGETADFGKVQVGPAGLRIEGRDIPWGRVTSITRLIDDLGKESLDIGEQGHILATSVKLGMPNREVLIETVEKLCPPHLLVKKEQRFPWER